MSACPDDVPWHRVINSKGTVSNWANSNRQQQLLEAEGILFYRGQLRLEENQWHFEDRVGTPQQHDLF